MFLHVMSATLCPYANENEMSHCKIADRPTFF